MPKPRRSRKEYQAAYRQTHPERVIHWQLNSYANALRRAGVNVLTDDQLATLLADRRQQSNESEG